MALELALAGAPRPPNAELLRSASPADLDDGYTKSGADMPKVILINPSMSTIGYSFITPRWLYVIAQATPVELVGDPIVIDESIERFRADIVNPGDIVGIGISTGNCLAGYRVLKQAKQRGAVVIMGGIHPTIFPDEPLEMGADAVVTGNGDAIWTRVMRDALDHNLQNNCRR